MNEKDLQCPSSIYKDGVNLLAFVQENGGIALGQKGL